MDNSINELWDVVVIGGGPAGMIAAGRAAERGRSVLLLEKNQTFGKKLLLTGGGRCNLTNYSLNDRVNFDCFGESKKFLYSVFARFGVEQTLNFFRERGVETKIEENGRVFPVTDRATTVLHALMDYMKKSGVCLKNGCAVKKLSKNGEMFVAELQNKEKIKTKSCIVATGGVSYPETGSTGEGWEWLGKMGHYVEAVQPSLVPIALKDEWVKKVSGVSLSDVELSSWQDGKKKKTYRGNMLFTHFGVSGPVVLNTSREIGLLLKKGEVVVALDFLPDYSKIDLKRKLADLLIKNTNKKIKNTLDKIIPLSLAEIVLQLNNINGETYNHSVRSEERNKLIESLKNFSLHVKSLLNVNKSIYSVGGIRPEEIDFRNMQSRLISNLFIVGDMLSIERPSGGFSLQLCWSIGYVAGDSV